MNGDTDIGKVYGYIHTEVDKLRAEITGNKQQTSERMHECQLKQVQSINKLTISIEKYISSATEHENNQGAMLKKLFQKVDNHADRLEPVEEAVNDYKERKKEGNKLRIAVYVSVATLIITSILKVIF